MTDPVLQDLDRELTNRFPNAVASSYDEFVDRILSVCMTVLNDTAEGQELMDPLLADVILNQLSPEAWSAKKVNLLKFMFFFMIDQFPKLKHEMAHHLYHELRKENPHE